MTLEKAKLKIDIYQCLQFVAEGVTANDKDMTRSYYEQLNDLIIKFLE